MMINMKVKSGQYFIGTTTESPLFINYFIKYGDFSSEDISSMIDNWIIIIYDT